MHVRVLGHAELAGGDVPLSGTKPREVLTFLGLHAGAVVTQSTLIDLLWGESPPKTAARSVQTHVSTLRRSTGADAVVRRGEGWVLDVITVDVLEFTSAVRHGKEASRAGDAEAAADHFEAALALWRGAPQLPATPRGQAEVTRWQETHDGIVEDRAEARLDTGEAADLIADLEAAVAEAPLRERRWAQLMLALYRSGRQAEALRAYQRLRQTLSEELGLEPSAEVQRLERRIALQDETLLLPPGAASNGSRKASAPRPRRQRRPGLTRRLAAAATEPMASVAAGAGGAVGIVAGGGVVGGAVLAGVGWTVAVVVPAAGRARTQAEGTTDVADLREPWREFVAQAQEAQQRFGTALSTAPAGPLHDRLQRIGDRVARGAQEARRVAARGQGVDDVRRNIDTFGIERKLRALEDEPSDNPDRIRTVDALRAQLAAADRLDRVLTEAHDRLRLLAAHLGEAVARSFELAVRSDGAGDLGEMSEDLDDVLEEMETIREALDDTDLAGQASA